MALEISNRFDFDASTDMIFMESDFEILAMDVQEYRDNILFASFEEETKPDRKNNYHDSNTTALTEDTSLQETDGDDDDECIHTEPILSVVPSHSPACSEAGEGNSVDMGSTDISKPGKLDVLCGQSRKCAGHSGNRRFQRLLDRYAPRYDAVKSKQEKMALTKEIVSCIQASGGRFLRCKDEQWQEISNVTARDKVSHALRTKVASWKKQNEQQQEKTTTRLTKSAAKKVTPRGRRSSRNQHDRQRSSSSSVNTRESDIPASSFDGSDPTSNNNLIEDLLKTQREIFANLQKHNTTPTPNNNDHPLRRSSR